jgi:hypothetical protein
LSGVTVSPNEIKRYVKLVVRNPILGQNYRVPFADVHDLQAASLPNFDLVTLFHLCEFGSATGAGHLLSEALRARTSKPHRPSNETYDPLLALDSPDWPRIFTVGAARAEAHF